MTVRRHGMCHGCGKERAVMPVTAKDGTKARRCAPCLRIMRERKPIVRKEAK